MVLVLVWAILGTRCHAVTILSQHPQPPSKIPKMLFSRVVKAHLGVLERARALTLLIYKSPPYQRPHLSLATSQGRYSLCCVFSRWSLSWHVSYHQAQGC